VDDLRIAVIGAGATAQVIHIPIWKKLPGVQLIAICDINKAKARWVAEKLKIPRAFSDDQELLKLDEIDAVDICTPNHMHMPVTLDALSAKKHVLVEKPMARNYEEAKRMVEAAKKAKKLLMAAMNVRFRPDAMALKQFVDGGELGKVFYAKSGWLRRKEKWHDRSWFVDPEISGGGVFMDLGIQMLDVSLWLMGNKKAKSVVASTYNLITKLGVEDSAAAFIRLEDDSTLTVEVSWTLLTERDFLYTNLFGTQGGALLNPLRVHKELHGNLVNVTPTKMDTTANLYKKSYENELAHFIQCLRGEETLISSGEESLERLRITEAVYRSAQTGQEVKLK